MNPKTLVDAGLSDAESCIYISLLKLGTCTVKELAKESGFHRTNIYDVLDQLREKGLVSNFREGTTAQYRAADPENLISYLHEKQEWLGGIIPDLKRLQSVAGEQVLVDVFKGEAGMKAMFNEILRVEKTLYAFGVKGQLREELPIFAQQWMREQLRRKIKFYAIYTDAARVSPNATAVRIVDDRQDQPVATFIYGDNVCINIWSPTLLAIVIRSKEVAQTYKRHFDLMWAVGKPAAVPAFNDGALVPSDKTTRAKTEQRKRVVKKTSRSR